MVKRLHKGWLTLTALAWLAACEPETKVVPAATQVMLRIYSNDSALLGAMEALHVALYVREGSAWDKRSHLDLSAGELKWPVDVPVLPPKADHLAHFEVVIDALGADSQPLAQARAVTSFVPGKRKLLEVWLFTCPGQKQCAAESCHGVACAVCTATGACAPVGMIDPNTLPDLDPTQVPRADLNDGGPELGLNDGGPKPGLNDGGPGLGLHEGGVGPDLDSGGMDSGAHHADGDGDASVSMPEFAIAAYGEPCQTKGAKACDGHNSVQPLYCSLAGIWELGTACLGDMRCQTAADSPHVGTCQSIVSACLGREPGSLVCDGTERRKCGVDLLSYEDAPCAEYASCESGPGDATCKCPEQGDGTESCEEVDDCELMPCANGGLCTDGVASRTCDCSKVDYSGDSCEKKIDDCASAPCQHGGRCQDGVRSFTCDCSETGYEGKTCEKPIDECAGTNVCSVDYPCQDLDPFYTCRGQFPDWNVSQKSSFTISGGIVTDARTGLRWKQAAEPSTYGWTDAKAQCRDGWRLPTRAELLSLLNVSTRPAIDETVFPSAPNEWFWTSSPLAGGSEKAWFVNVVWGEAHPTSTGTPGQVRCVR